VNPYRDAADEIERTWHMRQDGAPGVDGKSSPGRSVIRPMENLPQGGIPIPPVDDLLRAQVEEAELQGNLRRRRMLKAVLVSIAFVGMAFTIAYVITKVLQ
jgi:hypothetical protein